MNGSSTSSKECIDLGLDVYGYVTLTSPHEDGVARGVNDLLDRFQAIDCNFPLRVIPLRIAIYTPVGQRIARDTVRERSLAIQEEAIAVWRGEIDSRFSADQRAQQIYNVPLTRRGG